MDISPYGHILDPGRYGPLSGPGCLAPCRRNHFSGCEYRTELCSDLRALRSSGVWRQRRGSGQRDLPGYQYAADAGHFLPDPPAGAGGFSVFPLPWSGRIPAIPYDAASYPGHRTALEPGTECEHLYLWTFKTGRPGRHVHDRPDPGVIHRGVERRFPGCGNPDRQTAGRGQIRGSVSGIEKTGVLRNRRLAHFVDTADRPERGLCDVLSCRAPCAGHRGQTAACLFCPGPCEGRQYDPGRRSGAQRRKDHLHHGDRHCGHLAGRRTLRADYRVPVPSACGMGLFHPVPGGIDPAWYDFNRIQTETMDEQAVPRGIPLWKISRFIIFRFPYPLASITTG